MDMKTPKKQSVGFTLIELLVVVAIISMLVGLLTVGLRKTKIISTGLRQKSVFHSMEIGLELFSKDFDDYPDSKVLPGYSSANQVCGAQHLVEALVGRDEAGLEPRTGWYAPNDAVYSPEGTRINDPSYFFYDSTSEESRNRRKGPYVELKYVDVFTIYELWQGNNGPSQIYDSRGAAKAPDRAPVFTDTFKRITVSLPDGTSVRVGMPILYFKANRAAPQPFRLDAAGRNTVTNPGAADMQKWTYNFLDNAAVTDLPLLEDPTQAAAHYADPQNPSKNKAQVFYEQITQRSEPDRPFYKPFNANKYLLISAGWDGLYGTKDDITNFEY
jgi:prepilin-type N-terminal cleavage/methylation domain-containing protein